MSTGIVLQKFKSIQATLKILIYLIFCIFPVINSKAYADLISGPANVRNTPSGDVIFILNDNTHVDCMGTSLNGWVRVGLHIQPNKNEADEGLIKKGSDIIDGKGNTVGSALRDIKLNYDVAIDGYTYISNIRDTGNPEREIKKFLQKSKRSVKFEDLHQYLEKYKFQNWPVMANDYLNFKMYLIYENYLDNQSERPRLFLIFYKEKLIAIYHTMSITFKGYTTNLINFCGNESNATVKYCFESKLKDFNEEEYSEFEKSFKRIMCHAN